MTLGSQNDAMCGIQPANLDEATLASIRDMEAGLEGNICLVAVKKRPLYVLEAKTAPREWVNIREAYPQADLVSFFDEHETAKLAKSSLKSLLHGKWKSRFEKYPIRIREIG